MTLEDILKEIEEKNAEASRDVSALEPRQIPGAVGMVRAAKDRLVELSKLYKEEVMRRVVIIAVSGPYAEEFANIAKYAHKTLAVDYKGVVNRLVQNMHKRNANHKWTQHEHFMLLTELNQLKVDYDIQALPPPQINYATDNVNEKPLKEAVELIFNKNYGGGLYSAISRRDIQKSALDGLFSGKALPVVLYNYDNSLDTSMLPLPVDVLELTEPVNPELVAEKLGDVKNKLKGGKKAKTQQEKSK